VLHEPVNLYPPGVGGTGVLTLNGILSVAALLDGNDVLSFDQTGAAQKWGPVVSSLTVIPPGATAHASKVGAGQADVYLALDEVGACSPANLDRCSPDRTTAVTNTDLFPTGSRFATPIPSSTPRGCGPPSPPTAVRSSRSGPGGSPRRSSATTC